jgi:hypothetical protein
VASVTLDTDDVGRLEASGRLVDLILHELGHALGFGTLWARKGLLQNPFLPSFLPSSKGADTHFDGLSAVTAFDAIGGKTRTPEGRRCLWRTRKEVQGPRTATGDWRSSPMN